MGYFVTATEAGESGLHGGQAASRGQIGRGLGDGAEGEDGGQEEGQYDEGQLRPVQPDPANVRDQDANLSKGHNAQQNSVCCLQKA